jgi:phosphoenolpyruvate phosphomutase
VTDTKALALTRMLAQDRLVRAVGAHNGLTARLVELAGFDAVWASGLELSASYGLPDASLLTMTQLLDAAEAMDAATTIPVIADCDTGFGGPLNVAHMVRSYQRRGISAVCIEDKVFPKMNSFAPVIHRLLPVEAFAEKIRVAVGTRQPGRLVVLARTEALVAGYGVGEALTRARAYAAAGADAILVHSKSTGPDQVLEFAEAWDLPTPLVAVPTTYPQASEDLLHAAGFRVVIYANQGLRSMVRGAMRTLHELHEARCAKAVEDEICTLDEIFALQDSDAAAEVWS